MGEEPAPPALGKHGAPPGEDRERDGVADSEQRRDGESTHGITRYERVYFDIARTQTLVWFAAYVAYPLVGIVLAVRRRGEASGPGDVPLARRARSYLGAQGWC